MTTTHCICGTWAVRNANFCWRCGNELGNGGHTFESSIGNGNVAPGQSPISNHHTKPNSAKDKLTTTFLFAASAAAGALFADWDTSWIAFSPMVYLAYEPTKEFILGLAGKIPHELSRDANTTIKIEHFETDDAGKRFVGLYDLPQGIELCHLQHIAKVCLPQPLGEGSQFSRRKVTKAGTLSQNQFELLRDVWLDTHHAFYRNEAAPNLGICLTERCNRLLKKSLEIVAVVGGGW